VFTGIVEERGTVRSVEPGPSGRRLRVECRTVAADSDPGASVAVNGVCLTVAEREGDVLAFDVMGETEAKSTLGSLRADDRVNLERPVTLATRLGGHLVQGHVDGVGTVAALDGPELRVRIGNGLSRYVVEKGSIAVDGVSLTVTKIEDDEFAVALVPHTLDVTTLGLRTAGDRVNLEVDVLAKYVEGILGRKP
jgi:riboflavin synthase